MICVFDVLQVTIGMNLRGRLLSVSVTLSSILQRLTHRIIADKKTIEIKKSKGDDSDDSDARPKKAPAKGSGKAPAKAPAKNSTKATQKTSGTKHATNGKSSAKSSAKR
jgi:hypothetical protein